MCWSIPFLGSLPLYTIVGSQTVLFILYLTMRIVLSQFGIFISARIIHDFCACTDGLSVGAPRQTVPKWGGLASRATYIFEINFLVNQLHKTPTGPSTASCLASHSSLGILLKAFISPGGPVATNISIYPYQGLRKTSHNAAKG